MMKYTNAYLNIHWLYINGAIPFMHAEQTIKTPRLQCYCHLPVLAWPTGCARLRDVVDGQGTG